jgi:hypothetical protein
MGGQGMVGADPDQLEALGRTFTREAEKLRAADRAIAALVRSASWRGPKADAFKGQWGSGPGAAIGRAAGALDRMAGVVREQAQQQRGASAPGEGGGSGAGDFVPSELTPQGGLSGADLASVTAGIAGIFDPTPISDGIGGIIDLGRGDLLGAGLSVASMIPYLGDAAAKPAKLLKIIENAFPALKRAGGFDNIMNGLKHVPLKNPAKVNEALGTMNRLQKGAESAYENQAWLAKAQKLDLPTDGPVPFVPPKRWDVNNPRMGEINGRRGYLDEFGNVWVKGRGVGDAPFEWDVQVRGGLERLSKDGKHVNVTPGGKISH